jgi:mono/diheme cytochrome c family protein
MRKLLLAGILVAVAAWAPRAVSQQSASAAQPSDANKALITRYCAGCHNDRTKTANLALDVLDLSHPEHDPLIWERVIRKLRGGMMPPPGLPRPAAADVDTLATYLETSLDAASAANRDPGNVRIHRLNRAEYSNAVRDLFAIEVDATQLLPTDEIADGFDNIASALQVSPSFLDQYIMAARAVAKQAIGTPPSPEEAQVSLRGVDPQVPLPPGGRNGITARHLFVYEGDYELRAAGNPVVFLVDGNPVDTESRTHLTAGYHTVMAVSPSRSFAESEGFLQGFSPGAAGTGYASTGTGPRGGGGGGGGRGRGGAGGITIKGPFNPVGDPIETPSRARVFLCRPPAQSEEAACAARILSTLAEKAYRRPITETDLAPLMRFYNDARPAGTFETGIESALVAMLSSTKFLYRATPPPAGAAPGSEFRLSDVELASRLSFFLWATIPDDELRTLAGQNKLHEPEVLRQQVQRMLADPRSKTLTTNFAFAWLKVNEMDTFEPDPFIFPWFDNPLRQAFETEMELFVDSIFREDRSIVDLLNADYTFVNERLAAHYEVPNIRGDDFRRVTLTDPNRFGVLGKGAVLMVTAYPNRTSPVLRGAYVLEKLLGTPPAPPPPNVEAFKENKEGEQAKTIREILELHRANPTCNSCHGTMDPLGFALESFDTIGTHRTFDRLARTDIDTSGTLVDGTKIEGPNDLRKVLVERKDQFAQTFIEKLMMYGLGRSVEYFDMPAVRQIVRDTRNDDYRFSSIVMGIVNSPQFQFSQVEAAQSARRAPKQIGNDRAALRFARGSLRTQPASAQVAAN